jgi:hypothetical protein
MGHYFGNVGDEPVQMLELFRGDHSQTSRPTNGSG